jgi:nucleoid DNA-binding protein
MRTKKQYVDRLSELTGVTKAEIRMVLKAQEQAILECLKNGIVGVGGSRLYCRTVIIPGVVKLSVVPTPSREGRYGLNPATGSRIVIPSRPVGYRLKARFLAKAKRAVGIKIKPRYGKLDESPPLLVPPRKNRYSRDPVI